MTGEVELAKGTEMVMPGDDAKFTVKLITPIAMNEKLNFAIREGGKNCWSWCCNQNFRVKLSRSVAQLGRAPVSKTGGWGVRSPPLLPNYRNSMISPFKFIQAVKNEAFRVSWPTGRETLTGAAMVVLLAIVASIFFLIFRSNTQIFFEFCINYKFLNYEKLVHSSVLFKL